MTNEEAIELLNQEKVPMILDGKPNEHLVVAHIKAIEALQENTKLKAEIEQLKEELAQLKPSEPKHKPQKFHRFKDGEHKDVDATMSAYNRGNYDYSK